MRRILLVAIGWLALLSSAPASAEEPSCMRLSVVDANGAFVGAVVGGNGLPCPNCELGPEPILVARPEGGKVEPLAVHGSGFEGRGVPGLVPPFRFAFDLSRGELERSGSPRPVKRAP